MVGHRREVVQVGVDEHRRRGDRIRFAGPAKEDAVFGFDAERLGDGHLV
jgi:hypothetical protein